MIPIKTIRVAAALLLATTSVGSVRAYTIAAPGSVVAGRSIADWGVEWWKWALNAPVGASALDDTTGTLTQLDNNRAVFFMGGGANGFGPATSINVTVPYGTPVLLRLVNLIDFESAAYYAPGTSLAGRQAVATAVADGYEAAVSPSALSAVIDGDVVADPYQYRERASGFLSFGQPAPGSTAAAFFGLPDGDELDTGVATGWYLMLNDLSSGRHTLNLSGHTDPFDVSTADATFSVDAFSVAQTITLNVAAVPEPTSWALLLSGFGLTGALMRRRQKNVVVA